MVNIILQQKLVLLRPICQILDVLLDTKYEYRVQRVPIGSDSVSGI